MVQQPLITFAIAVPAIGAIIQAFAPERAAGGWSLSRWIALASSLLSSLIAIAAIAAMSSSTAELQLTESAPWIGSYAISYDMGLDGLNALILLLLAIVFPLVIASEWKLKEGVRGMQGLLLLLQASLIGAVCAQDLFLQFFFWALSTLPFYFLTGIWGGKDREEAAFRTIVTAALGNALLFSALMLVYHSLDPHTFSIRELSGGKLEARAFHFLQQELPVAETAFILASLGLALRIPVWPLHGWFTRFSEESPPSVFVAMAAGTVPVGAYLFCRLGYSLFPQTFAHASGIITIVGSVTLVVGGICALAQRGLRLLLAYLCLGEVGFALIGAGSLTQPGAVGSLYHLLAFGLGLAGLGLLCGIILDRTGEIRFLDDSGKPLLGGIASRAPTTSLVAGILLASLLGIPGLAGFVGHALLVVGGFSVYPVAVLIAGAILLLMTVYLLTMYRHVFLGVSQESTREFTDLTLRERAYLLPLIIAIVLFGVYPKPLIELVRPTVSALLVTMGSGK